MADGSVGVRWRILEHDDGAVIQLIVAGPIGEEIKANGSLEGQPAITSVTSNSSDWWFAASLALAVIVGGAMMRLVARAMIRQAGRPRHLAWTLVLSAAAVTCVVAVLYSFVLTSADKEGPLRFDTSMPDDRPPPPVPPGGP